MVVAAARAAAAVAALAELWWVAASPAGVVAERVVALQEAMGTGILVVAW